MPGSALIVQRKKNLDPCNVDPTAAITISYITLFLVLLYSNIHILLYLTFQYDNIVGIAMTIIMMTSK